MDDIIEVEEECCQILKPLMFSCIEQLMDTFAAPAVKFSILIYFLLEKGNLLKNLSGDYYSSLPN